MTSHPRPGGIQTPVGFPQPVLPAPPLQKLRFMVQAAVSGSQMDSPVVYPHASIIHNCSQTTPIFFLVSNDMKFRPHPFGWTAMGSGPDLLPERMYLMLTLLQPGHEQSHL